VSLRNKRKLSLKESQNRFKPQPKNLQPKSLLMRIISECSKRAWNFTTWRKSRRKKFSKKFWI